MTITILSSREFPGKDQLVQTVLAEMRQGIWGDEEEDVPHEQEQLRVVQRAVDQVAGLLQFDGTIPVIRSMYVKGGGITPGQVGNLGEHWTYSSKADLTNAVMFSSKEQHNILVFARAPAASIDWPSTVIHQILFPEEKEINVKGPVKVEKVVPIQGWSDISRAKDHFELIE